MASSSRKQFIAIDIALPMESQNKIRGNTKLSNVPDQ